MQDLVKGFSGSFQAGLKIRRALLSVSDKEGIVELAQALLAHGAEIVATGRTAEVLREAKIPVVPIEKVSGSPEAFGGRMKTLSFPVLSGVLYRRQNEQDEQDLKNLNFVPIDCVVVNFYPFENAKKKEGIARKDLIEEIDIGGPTLVRAAAKNAPDVLVLSSPRQYLQIIEDLKSMGRVSHATVFDCAANAWEKVLAYDEAITESLGNQKTLSLRYGENPHQSACLLVDPKGPIAWPERSGAGLTQVDLSYNNILDISSGYGLASDLVEMASDQTAVVIIKHNNPCGVAMVPKSYPDAQKMALMKAWEGDPVSAFGGVVVFTDPLEEETARYLAQYFVEAVAAPQLRADQGGLPILMEKRKKLKAVAIRRFGESPRQSMAAVPGGKLIQSGDLGWSEKLDSVTEKKLPKEKERLARFGVLVCRALKSNAIALVREIPSISEGLQLVGAGQGQPNRIEALRSLAIPRAQSVLEQTDGSLSDCVLVSDAFFPFRDTVDTAYGAGIMWIVQPGGSIKDGDSIAACNEQGVGMVFTGVRHFKH